MTRNFNINNVALLCIMIIATIMGVLSNNYVIAGMFIVTLVGAYFIVEEKNLYNLLYATLLVSVIYDYTLYVPRFEQVYMFHIILAIFSIISLFKAFRNRNILFNLDRKVLGIYVIWFIYMVASVFWALNRNLAIKYVAIYLMMFAFITSMMIYNVNKKRLNQTIKLLLYLVSIVVLIGFIEVLLGKQLPVKHYIDGFLKTLPEWQINTIQARPIVFSYNTNNLNALLSLLIPICMFSIYKFENIVAKIWFTIVSIVSFALVVITTSRTGYVAFLFGFAVFIVYSSINIKKIGVKQLIYPLILVCGFFIAYNYAALLMNIKPVKGETVKNSTSLSGKLHSLGKMASGGDVEEYSTLDRMAIINDVVKGVVTEEKNYFGFGVGNVEQYLREQDNTGSIYSPHCYPIEILGDFGLPGIALYGVYYVYLLIGNVIVAIKKKHMASVAIVAGLIAFAPASFGPSSITYVFAYWILMGLAVSNIQVEKHSVGLNSSSLRMKEYSPGI